MGQNSHLPKSGLGERFNKRKNLAEIAMSVTPVV